MPDFDLISDLHLDMRRNAKQLLEDIDPTSYTLVIAGDLCEARNLNPDWLHILSLKYGSVIYTPGNHEFYGSNFEHTIAKLVLNMPNNWYMLYNETMYLNGADWSGTPLWFPNQPDNVFYERHLSDFSLIGGYRDWVYAEHAKAQDFLTHTWGEVWVLHHLPFWRSVHPKYDGSNLNRFFVGDVRNALENNKEQPKVIVHGHTHEPMDYMAGDIRVVCNPFGYPGEGMAHIQPMKVSFNA